MKSTLQENSKSLRVLFFITLLILASIVGYSYFVYATSGSETIIREQSTLPFEKRQQIVPARTNITVVTAQGTKAYGSKSGEIVAFSPSGRLLYHNSTYQSYWDVDPVPTGKYDVMYVATEDADNQCSAGFRCNIQMVEIVNISTGDTRRVYSKLTLAAQDGGGKWHDVDWINETHLAVADIANDRAFIVNHKQGFVTWSWNFEQHYPRSAGGNVPLGYTHLNDIEVLQDGRIMLSPRNFDRVVFVNRQQGVNRSWTLGSENNHSILYEQHNPDYIPAEKAGPAILVADSENNRIVEYQRRSDSWIRTWTWSAPGIQWPRDADRLPNGHTLVTNTHGNEIVEVDANGEIVWSAEIYRPYEAERLGTGDESFGGYSAVELGIKSRSGSFQNSDSDTVSGFSISTQIVIFVKSLLPSKIVNALIFIRPAWTSSFDLILTSASLVILCLWGLVEAIIAGYSIRFPITRN